MTITIPIVNKLSLNKLYAGIHFYTRKKHKDEYRYIVGLYAKPYTGTYPVRLTFEYQLKGRLLDCSNCGYLTKLMEDGLVHSETLPDDSPKYVAEIVQRVIKGDNEVVITIEPYAQES